jgi:hypothetical protein
MSFVEEEVTALSLFLLLPSSVDGESEGKREVKYGKMGKNLPCDKKQFESRDES